MTWKDNARRVEVFLFGLVIALSGGFFVYKNPTHAVIFTVWTAMGVVIMAPKLVVPAAKQILILLPVDFKIGGLRKTDPPAPAAAPLQKPTDDTP